MIDKSCNYYPCHKGLEDCTYCFCPIYPCGYKEFGKFVKNKKIWDCSGCLIFHKKKIVDKLEDIKDVI